LTILLKPQTDKIDWCANFKSLTESLSNNLIRYCGLEQGEGLGEDFDGVHRKSCRDFRGFDEGFLSNLHELTQNLIKPTSKLSGYRFCESWNPFQAAFWLISTQFSNRVFYQHFQEYPARVYFCLWRQNHIDSLAECEETLPAIN
jgi:hypothetical protein